ncbi:hypothetical protein GCM10023155_12880 [Bremerella cremea]
MKPVWKIPRLIARFRRCEKCGKRACVVRVKDDKGNDDFAFRYLMLTPENGWEDRGWQLDEYGEFEHWYLDTGR